MAFMSPFTSNSILSFTRPKFRENAQDPADLAEPWVQDPSVFLPIFMGFESFHERNPLSHKTVLHGQSGTILRVYRMIMFFQNLRLMIKCPRAWNMSGYRDIKFDNLILRFNLKII